MGREGRLGLQRGLGEAPGLRHRGDFQAAPVRVREAGHLRRQGSMGHPVLRHLRSLGRALEGLDQRHDLPEEGLRRCQRDRVSGRDGVHPGDRDGRHAARARDEGVTAEPALPGRAGVVLQPGLEGGRHRRLVHGRGARERGALSDGAHPKSTGRGPRDLCPGPRSFFGHEGGRIMTKRTMLAVAIALAVATSNGAARADVVPGDKITDQNIDKVKDLISPGLEWCIKHGFPITISETKKVEWPKAYKEATEKYAAQVKLSPDGKSMANYVAGQPFPNVDQKDPQFVLKLMFNYDYGYINGLDDTDLRNFDADTGAIADHGPMTVERHFLLDHFRRLFWTGRLYVDPKPEKPNPSGYRAQQGLYPILEPFDLKGVGALGNRYTSPDKQDDSWLYLPSLRRVRRLSTAQRSDALFGQDTDVDSYYGYAGQVGWMDWKFLGERDIIGILHGEHYPVKWHEKVDWAMDEKWEKRRVY